MSELESELEARKFVHKIVNLRIHALFKLARECPIDLAIEYLDHEEARSQTTTGDSMVQLVVMMPDRMDYKTFPITITKALSFGNRLVDLLFDERIVLGEISPASVNRVWSLLYRDQDVCFSVVRRKSDIRDAFRVAEWVPLDISLVSVPPAPDAEKAAPAKLHVAGLLAALESIQQMQRMNTHEMDDDDRGDYWSGLALRYRNTAAKALDAYQVQIAADAVARAAA